jgi:coenzyme F420-reducing hydrogenase delta subunit
LLQEIGLEAERIRMVNLSSAMGSKFAELTSEMFEEIKEIGLNPLKQNRLEQEASQASQIEIEDEKTE